MHLELHFRGISKHTEREFVNLLASDGTLVYCTDIALIAHLDVEYEASQWRLFIDSSKRSLKGVLLHNGNECSSVPVAHSVVMKEEYTNMKILLDKLNYNEHRWLICGDLELQLFSKACKVDILNTHASFRN